MKRICLDIWYRLKKPSFLFAVILGSLSLLIGIMPDLVPTWKYREVGLIYLYDVMVAFSIFDVVVMLIAILPNISRLSSFLGDGHKYEQMRCGTGKWLIGEVVSSGFIGGLVAMLAIMLVMGFLSLHYPMTVEWDIYDFMDAAEVNASFSNLLIAGKYGTWLTVKFILVFLYGASANILAILIASCTKDSFVISFLPIMVVRTVSNWTDKMSVYLRPRVYLRGDVGGLQVENSMEFFMKLLSNEVLVWIVLFVITWVVNRRRIKNA